MAIRGRGAQGVTLVQVMIVVGVLALVAAFAVPHFMRASTEGTSEAMGIVADATPVTGDPAALLAPDAAQMVVQNAQIALNTSDQNLAQVQPEQVAQELQNSGGNLAVKAAQEFQVDTSQPADEPVQVDEPVQDTTDPSAVVDEVEADGEQYTLFEESEQGQTLAEMARDTFNFLDSRRGNLDMFSFDTNEEANVRLLFDPTRQPDESVRVTGWNFRVTFRTSAGVPYRFDVVVYAGQADGTLSRVGTVSVGRRRDGSYPFNVNQEIRLREVRTQGGQRQWREWYLVGVGVTRDGQGDPNGIDVLYQDSQWRPS